MAGTNILVRQKDLIAGSGISITPDTTSGNVTIAATNTAIDESRLLPETGSVSSDSVGNPVIFKAISRIDNTYWLCLPLNEDTNDRSTYDVATRVYGTVNIVSNAPSSPGGSAFFNGSSCLHGTLPAQFGSGDFTVRFWMMAPTISSSSSSQTIFSTRRGNQTDADTFGLLCTTEGRLFIYSNGDITSRTDTPFTLQSNVWYHVAVVRNSGVLTIYVNGEVYNSATFTNSLTRQIFGLGASWTGSSYSEAGTVYLTSLDVLNYAAYDGAFTTPAYQPGILAGMGYAVATDSEVTDMLSAAGIDESRLIPTGGRNANLLEYQEGVDRGNGSDVRLLLQNAMTDSANGNAAPAAVTTQGVTLTGDNNLLFDGNDSHVTAVLATDEIFAADKEWTIDFWMKPAANSSEWNYILTENRGDWGSHSIGLTWNKTKNALEQDTGGYVASVIKAPNWPNNSVACAAGEWHFVAVEKQKTATGWSLNYYLNGAIWLQVAFTADFVPFDASDNPFWFGGKTTDSGRWFKGEVNKLRVTVGARYGGKAFAVPDRLTDYAAPAGQPVWTEGIDRSRLLPENPANGDIPCFDATATVGGGNDSDTVLLIQPVTSNNQIVNQAVGGGDRVVLQNTNVMVLNTGEMTFAGNAYLSFNPNSVTSLFLKDSMPWTLDLVYNVSSKSMQCLFGRGTSPRMDFLLQSNGNLEIGGGPSLGSGWPFDTDVRLTFEVYMEGGNQKYTAFRDGTPVASGTWSVPDLHDSTLWIGWDGDTDSRKITGWIKALRMTDTATHNGAAFTPDELPWTEPQVVGEWGKFNKAELVKSVNGQLPDSSGAVTIPVATASAAGLMAAADKNALDNLRYATQAGAINFNSFSGLNACYTLLNGAHTNGPLTGTYSGTLDIISDRTSYVTTQRFTQLTTNKSFIRTYAFDTSTLKGTWSEWSKVIVNTDIATTSAAGLMTATDKVKLDALQQAATYINIATDFNTYKTAGSYFLKGAVHTNGPLTDSYAGTLVVVTPVELEYITQYFTQLYTNKTFCRTYSKDNTKWNAWNRVIVDTDMATTSAAGLMAAADKAAIAGLTAQGIYPNVAVAAAGSGIDYNLFKTQGTFYIPYHTAVSNGPVSVGSNGVYPGGFLSILQANLSGGTSVQQIFHLHANNKAYIRSYNGDTDTWSAWNRVIVDTDLATTTVAGLMSATDREKSIGLTTRGFYPNALAKSGAVDFNEVIDHGFYFIGGDTPHLNYPETYQQNGGTLQVIRHGNYLTQTFIPLNINTVFIRTCVNALSDSSAHTFSAWRRALTNTGITESKALPGYFKLPGGTIVQWGNFEVTADPQTQEITLPVALSSVYVRQASGSNSALRIGIYGGPGGKITCYVDGKTSGTVGWMVIGK